MCSLKVLSWVDCWSWSRVDGDPDMALEATRVKHTGPLTIHFTKLKQTPCFHFMFHPSWVIWSQTVRWGTSMFTAVSNSSQMTLLWLDFKGRVSEQLLKFKTHVVIQWSIDRWVGASLLLQYHFTHSDYKCDLSDRITARFGSNPVLYVL